MIKTQDQKKKKKYITFMTPLRPAFIFFVLCIFLSFFFFCSSFWGLGYYAKGTLTELKRSYRYNQVNLTLKILTLY